MFAEQNTLYIVTLLFLSVVLGCEKAATPIAPSANAEESKEQSVTVDAALSIQAARNRDGASGSTSAAPGEQLHVSGRYKFSGPGKPPAPIIEIVRVEGGRKVIHDSVIADQKKVGDVYTFNSMVFAPHIAGDYAINAVNGRKPSELIASSPLEVQAAKGR